MKSITATATQPKNPTTPMPSLRKWPSRGMESKTIGQTGAQMHSATPRAFMREMLYCASR